LCNDVYISTALVGLAILTLGVSRSHSDTPQSVGLLWRCDRPIAQISTWLRTILTRNWHSCARQDLNPQSQQMSSHIPMA